MSLCVLLPVYSHSVKNVRAGITYHVVCQALALRRAAAKRGIRVIVASTPGEDAPGLWDRVWSEYPADDVVVLEDEDTALGEVVDRLLQEEKRVIAHVQGSRQLKAVIPHKRSDPQKLRIVYTVHSFRNASWKRRLYSWLVSGMLRRYVDYTMYLSPFAIDQFTNSRRVLHGGRGGLIPLGVDEWTEWRHRRPVSGEISEEVVAALTAPNAFRFVYLAAFKPGKGHKWLVEGAASVLRARPDVQIVLAGWGEARIRDTVCRRAATLGIEKQVVFAGSVPRDLVPWLLRQCHAGVVPSRSETFGQSILEPMRAGLPVISTRKGVGEWLVMDYLTGLAVNHGDRTGLSRAMDYLVRHPHAAAEMGRNATEIVREVFHWGRLAETHLRLYESLFVERAKTGPVASSVTHLTS